ncbi:hypothetical protein BN873_280012 [Candidatus Competibacter denitrificans Run_A_D11]|uniref:Uncharacterized protein n=1 Tax=Candidatus Competibacter denitrificans Run_A_D11 TaxID=1400863 RepID=W6M3L8_9GAMM|nr:hypothetical protein [Candidatus Competibacter denitrificans]CDI02326.1 hypothetical protein BN873_280012 [Candidatus Competibacter denitrificans Run_A_D11]
MTHSEHEPLGQILFKWLLAVFVLGCLIWEFIAHGTEGFLGAGIWLFFAYLCFSPNKRRPAYSENPFQIEIEQERLNTQMDTDPLYKMYTHNLNHNK